MFIYRAEIYVALGNTTVVEGGGGGAWGVALIYMRTRPEVNKKVRNYIRFFGVFGVGFDFF